MKSRLFAFTLVILAAALGEARAENPLVRLTYSTGWDALPAIIAIERDFFAEEGLTVSGMPATNTAGVINSIIAGSSDFALVPQRALLLMAAEKLDFSVVSMNGWGTEMELVVRTADTASKSLKDLKGKTVVVGAGSEAVPVLMRLLNAAQMTAADITISRVQPDQLVKAFQQPNVHAVFDTRHYTLTLTSQKAGRVLMSNDKVSETIGRIGGAPLIANKNVLKNEPETAQKFLNAWVRALSHIQKNPEDSARLLQIYFHRQGLRLTEEIARSWVEMTRYDRYTWSDDDVTDAEYNGWGLQQANILKIQPKLKGYVDNRFATAAEKTLK